MKKLLVAFVLLGSTTHLTGCSSAYYAAMEKIGIPKRDLMVKRVKATQESEQQAKEQFKDALEKFRSVLEAKGGKLGDKYDALSAELQRSEERARDVTARINSVEDVSEALFSEWHDELSKYSNQELRRESEAKLKSSRVRYTEMIKAMRRAEARLEPVLKPLRDNVLFLKHNLNAQVLSSLDGELRNVETNVDELLRDLERSIQESNRFIGEINEGH